MKTEHILDGQALEDNYNLIVQEKAKELTKSEFEKWMLDNKLCIIKL